MNTKKSSILNNIDPKFVSMIQEHMNHLSSVPKQYLVDAINGSHREVKRQRTAVRSISSPKNNAHCKEFDITEPSNLNKIYPVRNLSPNLHTNSSSSTVIVENNSDINFHLYTNDSFSPGTTETVDESKSERRDGSQKHKKEERKSPVRSKIKKGRKGTEKRIIFNNKTLKSKKFFSMIYNGSVNHSQYENHPNMVPTVKKQNIQIETVKVQPPLIHYKSHQPSYSPLKCKRVFQTTSNIQSNDFYTTTNPTENKSIFTGKGIQNIYNLLNSNNTPTLPNHC